MIYEYSNNQNLSISDCKVIMPDYLQVRSNGQITLPAPIRRKAKIAEGDLLEAVVEPDGSIRLVPKLALDRSLAEKYQFEDLAWAENQKDQKA
jgi:AbrB family looped-hinge helix DNA binding protein